MDIRIKCEGASKVSLASLIPFQGNLKTLTEENYEKFKGDIIRHGLVETINVWPSEKGPLIANGHMRLYTLKGMIEEGFSCNEIPVSYCYPESEKEFAEIILSLTSNYGILEKQGLYEYMSTHGIEVAYLDSVRFPEIKVPEFKMEFYEHGKEGLTDADAIPEVTEPICKTGDLWSLGNHKLLCGDATKKEDVERLMNGERADMVFTSPPYNLGHNTQVNSQVTQVKYRSREADTKTPDKYLKLLAGFLEASQSFSKYQFVNLQMLSNNKREILEWLNIFKDRFCDVLIWDKKRGPIADETCFTSQMEMIFIFGPNNKQSRSVALKPFGNFPNVFELPSTIEKNDFKHMAMFPVALPEKFISNLTDFGSLILEPFCGSGSTLIACEKTNRRCFGLEIDPHYCDVILKRFETFSGLKAVKIDN